ncbi:Na(+)/H(+) antiporter-like protein 1 [Elsinoe australis]|uniref:Na(+)/H(+) antiporter-like protein 1 n=1 Tax=Elsinoe australis TaxID=40998 RepID=A0A4U7AR83_9PEZI|nr:Na(+)/H(+) antiporter-like protein 1 [Elsinoe australis]
MPTLAVDNFNIVCAVLGGFITCFGLVSYLLKEKFYLSEALISLIAGLIFSPHATNLIRPIEYALNDELALDTITLYFTRLVLGVQLVLAGVQLPSRYLKLEWKSLSLLIGPGMCGMWMCTSLLVWGLVPNFGFVPALAVGACVTPTDPVLSNTIVKGKFADKNIPRELQKIIIAESGTNDGLGYPFLFLPLYLIKYYYGPDHSDGDAGRAIGLWFGETWGYTILLSVVYGAVVGWLAKELLHWAEERKYVDRESFLVFAITLALFIVGTCGMIGSDDILACFVAGNAFTWDDWFRLETLDDSLQPTIDMLLNVTIFIWFGAVCPWRLFSHSEFIPIYRLIPLGVLVLLFRRLPVVFALHKFIHQIEGYRHALFVGFFGPIGVSAIFYLYITREFLEQVTDLNGEQRSDAHQLSEVTNVVVWFMVICSIIVHGISIPLGKLGFYLPRTISAALATPDRNTSTARLSSSSTTSPSTHETLTTRLRAADLRSSPSLAGVIYRLKRSFFGEHNVNPAHTGGAEGSNISAPTDGRPLGRSVSRPEPPAQEQSLETLPGAARTRDDAESEGSGPDVGPGAAVQGRVLHRAQSTGQDGESAEVRGLARRTIRFGDEAAESVGRD